MAAMRLWNRHSLSELAREDYDLAIVGGGINGAGIARDAAQRGLRVILLEKNDFAFGTSSRSTKLAHGGLRYLETFEFALVHESLRERGILLKTLAPHLVKPMPFLVPFYRGDRWPAWYVKAGLWLYDLLAIGSGIVWHRSWSRDKTLGLEPTLNPEGLKGSAEYWDSQMNDARLVLENILDAERLGARCQNYARVVSAHALRLGEVRLRVRDEIEEGEAEIRASLLINAAGPWVDQLLRLLGRPAPPLVKVTKGIHLISRPLTQGHALFLPVQGEKRIFFVIPWTYNGKAASLIGTTDTDFRGDLDHLRAEADDAAYLLQQVKRYFPQESFRPGEIFSSYAGLRPLRAPGAAAEGNSGISRESAIVEDEGILSLSGGKFTTFRSMSERTVDRAMELLAKAHPRGALSSRASQTASRPLPGAPKSDAERKYLLNAKGLAARSGLEEATLHYLLSLYGTATAEVLALCEEEPLWKEALAPGSPAILAQVVMAVRFEKAQHLTDFYLRRTFLGLELEPNHRGVDRVAALMGRELRWTKEEEGEELEQLRRVISGEYR